jgi:hypothetical protein
MIVGIYLLIHNHEVVYIGQTMKIKKRLSMHKRDKVFDRYHFFKIHRDSYDKIDDFESRLIARFNPKYNKRRNCNGGQGMRRLAIARDAQEQVLKKYRTGNKIVTSDQKKKWTSKH